MRQRSCPSRRPSYALRTAALVAAAVPALALAPGALASADTGIPDLVVSELPTAPALQPGHIRQSSVTLTNNGTAPAHDIAFRVRLSPGLAFPEHQDGCRYTTTDGRRQALCTLGPTVEPGASVAVPLPLKALPDALMETVEYGTSPTGEAPGEGFTASYRQTSLAVDSSADLAAVGDRAHGGPGRTVTVRPALRNDGPGRVEIDSSDDQPALMVTVPKGTVAVRVPSDCLPFAVDGPSGPSAPGKPQYVCSPSDHILETGSVHTYPFRLRIGKNTRTASAEVRATSVYDIHPDFDHDTANDTATITVSTGHGHSTARALTSATPSAPGSGTAAKDSDENDGTHSSHAAHTPVDAGHRAGVALAADAHDDAVPTGEHKDSTPLFAGAAAVAGGLAAAAWVAARRRRTRSC